MIVGLFIPLDGARGLKEKEDILAFVLTLNLALATQESKGDPLTPARLTLAYHQAIRVHQPGLRAGG